MRNGRLGWFIAAVVAIAAAFWYRQTVMQPPAPRPMGSVVVVTGGPGPYWQTIANGARAAAKECDVEVRIENPQNDENVNQQTEILAKLDLTNVAGVAVSPLDAEGQTSLINKIADQAVVVTLDSDAPESMRDTYIGTHNYAAGKRAAELVKEAVPEGGKLVVVLANLTKNNMLERREGFETAIEKAASQDAATDVKYQVVDYLVDEGNEEKCRELLTGALEAHPDLACVVGMNGYHGPLLLELFKSQDRLGQIKLITFDDEPETLAGVEAGEIYATVAQDPFLYGYKAVERLAMVCRGSDGLRPLQKVKSTYSVNTQTIRQDNVADFRQQVKERVEAAAAK